MADKKGAGSVEALRPMTTPEVTGMASEQTTDLGAHGVVTADYFLVYIERGGEVFAIDNSGHHYRNFEHAEAQAERTNDQIRNGTTGWPIDDITGDEQAYVVTADGTVV